MGLHLARILAEEGREVVALVHGGPNFEKANDLPPTIRVLEGDVMDMGKWMPELKKISPEICVHLAWITTPGVYLQSPLNGQLAAAGNSLATALAQMGCKKFVAAGTCFEYDTSRGILSESTPTDPKTPYASSKLALYRLLESRAGPSSMPIAWTRLFYLYGPGEHPRRLVPTLIHSLMTGTPAKLSSGDKVRDYLHVEDVASAIWEVAKSDLTGPVNIGSGRPVTLQELAEKISAIFGKSGLIQTGALPDDALDPKHVQADNSRLLKHTRWKPKYTLDEGLRQTVAWWKGRAVHAG